MAKTDQIRGSRGSVRGGSGIGGGGDESDPGRGAGVARLYPAATLGPDLLIGLADDRCAGSGEFCAEICFRLYEK